MGKEGSKRKTINGNGCAFLIKNYLNNNVIVVLERLKRQLEIYSIIAGETLLVLLKIAKITFTFQTSILRVITRNSLKAKKNSESSTFI